MHRCALSKPCVWRPLPRPTARARPASGDGVVNLGSRLPAGSRSHDLVLFHGRKVRRHGQDRVQGDGKLQRCTRGNAPAKSCERASYQARQSRLQIHANTWYASDAELDSLHSGASEINSRCTGVRPANTPTSPDITLPQAGIRQHADAQNRLFISLVQNPLSVASMLPLREAEGDLQCSPPFMPTGCLFRSHRTPLQGRSP